MNIGKISAGTFLVIFACGIFLGLVLIGSGNEINSNVSDSGGGIEFAVGFMIIGAGYLVIAGSVLWAVSILIIAAIAYLVSGVGTKQSDRNEANSAAGQQISDPDPKGGSKDIQRPHSMPRGSYSQVRIRRWRVAHALVLFLATMSVVAFVASSLELAGWQTIPDLVSIAMTLGLVWLWGWMAFDLYENGSAGDTKVWWAILILLNFFGVLIYFISVWRPRNRPLKD